MSKSVTRRYIAWGLSISRSLIFDMLPFQIEVIVDQCPTQSIDPWTGIKVIEPKELANFDPNQTTIIVLADLALNFYAIRDRAAEFGHHSVIPFSKYFPSASVPRCLDEFENIKPFELKPSPRNQNRVVILIWELVVGGAEKQARLLKAGLEKIGFEVDLICCIGSSQQGSSDIESRALLYRDSETAPMILSSHESQIYETACRLAYPLIAFLSAKLYSELVNIDPDALIAYLEAPMLCASIADRFYGKNNLVFRGWLAPNDQLPPTFLNCDYSVAKCILQTSVKLGQATFITDSDMGVKSYKRWLEIDITHQPNAIEPVPIKRRTYKLSGSYSSVRQRKLVITAMRLVPQKNPHYFVKLIKRLYESGIFVRGSILGDGPLRKEIQESIERLNLSEIVTIEGFRNDVETFMENADLFVLPSHFEGMSNALMEACAAEIPFVASRTEGTLNAIPIYLHRWLVDIHDEVAFYERALEALMGKFGFDRDLQEEWLLAHSKEKLAKDLLSMLPKPM